MELSQRCCNESGLKDRQGKALSLLTHTRAARLNLATDFQRTDPGQHCKWKVYDNGLSMNEKTLPIRDFTMPVMDDYDKFHRANGKETARNRFYLPAEIQKYLKKHNGN